MPHPPRKRLPETRSLSQILPKGTEGGKEFARIIDLLLFHDARRHGVTMNIFSDASGDYDGLDSFFSDRLRTNDNIGYQYTFYQSPLSPEHRHAIKESLETAAVKARRRKKNKTTKWILVTPDDFTESPQKKGGGDVGWFEGLKSDLSLPFEIEHWGHRHLQALFLETPSLCLYYYPELVADGQSRRRTIEDVRKPYDENLLELYRRIAFVGMSVYKQNATRGVPMEDIYIPLSAVPHAAGVDEDDCERTNPLTFLRRGQAQVLLGDPGSGKSTLLRFLALVGKSRPLQKRCKGAADSRLPILIVLRKYAAELQKNPDIPLLDYVVQSIKAAFSLNTASIEFFEYYLETGQAILLFDGLDELGSPTLKKAVRDRIVSLTITYPANTVLVTSRVVGYDSEFGFDEKVFLHYRLGRLRKPEISRFVQDWYRARIESENERTESVSDLIRVLTEESHAAIQDLAANPLLLTIIALVHRIDAVLPDERVVLYQKCTETLLNTWHTWQFKEFDVNKRGKTERRNRQRMEAIAHWMQTRPRANSKDPRTIVKQKELSAFLVRYIEKNEKLNNDEDVVDIADDFIAFIRERAGLLIEIGDSQFSFVHLTFQEYLAASWYKTQCEKDGVEAVWKSLSSHVHDSAWHEVVRLLIASLTSDDAQEALTERLLKLARSNTESLALLSVGLLLDGVASAEQRQDQVLSVLLNTVAIATSFESQRKLVVAIQMCVQHDVDVKNRLSSLAKAAWIRKTRDSQRLCKTIPLLLAGWSIAEINEITIVADNLSENERLSLSLVGCGGRAHTQISKSRMSRFARRMTETALYMITVGPAENITGIMVANVIAMVDRKEAIESLFKLAAFALRFVRADYSGPCVAFCGNMTQLLGRGVRSEKWYRRAVRACVQQQGIRIGDPGRSKSWQACMGVVAGLVQSEDSKEIAFRPVEAFELPGKAQLRTGIGEELGEEGWNEVLEDHGGLRIATIMCILAEVEQQEYLSTAISRFVLPSLSQDVPITIAEMLNIDVSSEIRQEDIAALSLALLIDSGLCISGALSQPAVSPFNEIANATRESVHPQFVFAHGIRDLAYGMPGAEANLMNILGRSDAPMRKLLEDIYWYEGKRRKRILRRDVGEDRPAN